MPGPISGALRLIGADQEHVEPTAALALAAGLDDGAKPRRILSALRRRGDEEIVALLEAWVRSPAERCPGVPPESPRRGSDE